MLILDGPVSHILMEILDELEKCEELKMKDSTDLQFFVYAMETANKHIGDMKTGDRLHKLLLTKKNYKLLGGRLKVIFTVFYYYLIPSELATVVLRIFLHF